MSQRCMSQHTVPVQALGQCDGNTTTSAIANQLYQLNFLLFLKINCISHMGTPDIHGSYTFPENPSCEIFLRVTLPLCLKDKSYPAPRVQIGNIKVSAAPVEHHTSYCTCTKCCDGRHCSVCYDQDLSK